jgi:hypothetical protein
VCDVDAPEGFLRRPTQLEARIIADDRTGVIAELAVDLLDRTTEVAHELLGGFGKDRKAVGGHEHLGLDGFSATRQGVELMAHLQHVLDQADLDGCARKQRAIAFANLRIGPPVQQGPLRGNYDMEAHPGQQPDRFRCLREGASAADGVVALRVGTLQGDAKGQTGAVAFVKALKRLEMVPDVQASVGEYFDGRYVESEGQAFQEFLVSLSPAAQDVLVDKDFSAREVYLLDAEARGLFQVRRELGERYLLSPRGFTNSSPSGCWGLLISRCLGVYQSFSCGLIS